MRALLAGAIVVAGFFASVGVTFAQNPQCVPFEQAERLLSEKHGESPRFAGLVEDASSLFMVWLNETTGTWTLIVVRPDGVACLVGHGQAGAMKDALPAGVPG